MPGHPIVTDGDPVARVDFVVKIPMFPAQLHVALVEEIQVQNRPVLRVGTVADPVIHPQPAVDHRNTTFVG